jgi:GT2 family glycosyltransferase
MCLQVICGISVIMPSLAISIVSHGQGELVKSLLDDLSLQDFSAFEAVIIIVTLNITEDESFMYGHRETLTIIRNPRPLGFGANHNQAFATTEADYFLVLNPDVRIAQSFCDQIIQHSTADWGCMAPLVMSPDGLIEDSARRYPTVLRISRRVFLNQRDSDYDVSGMKGLLNVDWTAGMCLIFRSDVFRVLNGFDHRYFMYLEDADICRRSNRAGYPVVLNPNFSVVHDARRNSFKNSTHLKWHLRSMFRFIFGF